MGFCDVFFIFFQDDFQLLCGRDAASMRQLAGYGFGLPLSRVYAQQLCCYMKFMRGGFAIVCMCIYHEIIHTYIYSVYIVSIYIVFIYI